MFFFLFEYFVSWWEFVWVVDVVFVVVDGNDFYIEFFIYYFVEVVVGVIVVLDGYGFVFEVVLVEGFSGFFDSEGSIVSGGVYFGDDIVNFWWFFGDDIEGWVFFFLLWFCICLLFRL